MDESNTQFTVQQRILRLPFRDGSEQQLLAMQNQIEPLANARQGDARRKD